MSAPPTPVAVAPRAEPSDASADDVAARMQQLAADPAVDPLVRRWFELLLAGDGGAAPKAARL